MVAHAFLKITLFMCAGAIFVTAGLSEISSMKGLSQRMPITCACFTVSSLGIAGLPLMAGFVSKFNILEGALKAGWPLAIAVLIAAALLALTYLIPVVRIFFAKEMKNDEISSRRCVKDAAPAMLIPLMLTAIIAVVLGFLPDAGPHLYDMAQMSAESITGEGGAYLAG